MAVNQDPHLYRTGINIAVQFVYLYSLESGFRWSSAVREHSPVPIPVSNVTSVTSAPQERGTGKSQTPTDLHPLWHTIKLYIATWGISAILLFSLFVLKGPKHF